MWTIVGALKSEISPLFDAFPVLKKTIYNSGTLYESAKLHLLRTGVGWQSAGKSFAAYLKQHKPDTIINIGLAGCLSDECVPGQIYSVHRVVHEKSGAGIEVPHERKDKQLAPVSLLTVDEAVFSNVKRNQLFHNFTTKLVDMEAFYLAEICTKNAIPFKCIKITSDNADEQAREVFMQNYKILSRQLCEYVKMIVLKE